VDDLNRLALQMQDLLTHTADRVARECDFVRRVRKLTGSGFAQAVVFTWLGEPDASQSSLQGVAASVGLNRSRQGLDQRFTPQAAEFLRRLLADAATRLIDSKVVIPLLDRFTVVEVRDSSTIALPDELAAVYRGGRSGTTSGEKAALKLTLALDLRSGSLRGPELGAGRAADLSFGLATADPPGGGLALADLSYFSLEKFRSWGLAGAYWLSRLKVRTAVYDGQERRLALLAVLRAAGDHDVDLDVHLGSGQRLACRLIAHRVPAEVARLRRRRLREKGQRRGEPVSALALALADWTILVTNVPGALLSVEEALALARMRWQIELVFKRWKSGGGIDRWRSRCPQKVLCGVYGKLLAMVVEHWTMVTGCWSLPDRSPTKAARMIGKFALSLALAIRSLPRLRDVLRHAKQVLGVACRMEKRKVHSAHEMILGFDP
jgi:Transposase DDE domain